MLGWTLAMVALVDLGAVLETMMVDVAPDTFYERGGPCRWPAARPPAQVRWRYRAGRTCRYAWLRSSWRAAVLTYKPWMSSRVGWECGPGAPGPPTRRYRRVDSRAAATSFPGVWSRRIPR